MDERARVGVVFIRSKWFDGAASDSLLDILEEDQIAIQRRLEQNFSVLGRWCLDSMEGMAGFGEQVVALDLDFILLASQTWGDDSVLQPVLNAIRGIPLVAWCYLPWRRAPRPMPVMELSRGFGGTGVLGALGTLKNLGIDFLSTFGALDDPQVMRELQIFSRAAILIRRGLPKARFGLLPVPRGEALSSHIDPAILTSQLGPDVMPLDFDDLVEATSTVADGEVEQYLARIDRLCEVGDISRTALHKSARTALAIRNLARKLDLDLICLSDNALELRTALGFRPGLPPDLLAEENGRVIYQPDGDLSAAVANFILNGLSGQATFFMELWFWDNARNTIVGGHSGIHDPRVMAPGLCSIQNDTPVWKDGFSQGAQMQFIARPGRVTLMQLRHTPNGWSAIATSGVSLEIEPWVENIPHCVLRLDCGIQVFLSTLSEAGTSPHWVVAYGSYIPEIQALAKLAGWRLTVV